MQSSLKHRFALILSATTFVVAVTQSIILIGVSRSDIKELANENLEIVMEVYEKQLEYHAKEVADRLANASSNPLHAEDYSTISNYIQLLSSARIFKNILLLSPQGDLLADGTNTPGEIDAPKILSPDQIDRITAGETLIEKNELTVSVYRPVKNNNNLLGIISVEANYEFTRTEYQALETAINAQLGEKLRLYSAVAISTLVLLLVITYFAAAKLAALLCDPILKLRDQVYAIGNGDSHHINKISSSDEIGELANAVYSMASDLEMQNQSVKFLAFQDPLTGLLNRTGFQSRLEESLEILRKDGQSGTLLFIDIDDFKEVNDSLGHTTGDRALRALGDRLRKTVQNLNSDARIQYLARIGGDEFTIFLAPLHGPAEISILAEEILSALSTPVLIENERVHTSASIGIATFPEDGDTVSSLLNNADAAMYTSKHLGKGTYRFYEPKMNNALFRSATIKVEFQKALRNEDELELLFQPIINLSTGVIAAAEALIRWHHPRLGYLSPEQFIAIVEHNEVALPTDLWVLNKTLILLADINAAELPDINLSVNVSASNLLRKQFPAGVRKLITNRENLAQKIKLEITETFLHSDDDQVKDNMISLRDMGFKIWLDDFGTGYSSLKHLKDFPIDGIKIDQTFIASLMESDSDRNMVAALMALANAFSAEVVAEGIDRQESLDTLRKWGVKFGQGMVISEPVTPLRLVQLLGEIRSPTNE